MIVSLLVELTHHGIGSVIPAGSQFRLGKECETRPHDGPRFALWNLEQTRIVVPFAKPEWFEVLEDA